ncbi:hypothetical protein ABZ754_22765 [Micromonospora purpureochromogenes]
MNVDASDLRRRFAALTTAHVADACLRAGVPVRCAPAAVPSCPAGGSPAG